jgi:hypothetical protein
MADCPRALLRRKLIVRVLALLSIGTIAPAAMAQSQGPNLMDLLRGSQSPPASPAQTVPQAPPRASPQPVPQAASQPPPAAAASAPVAPSDGGARAAAGRDSAVEVTIGPTGWSGNVAAVTVYVTNTSAAVVPASILACAFIAQGQVLGTARDQVAALRPGERATITSAADVGGQLIDIVSCRGE